MRYCVFGDVHGNLEALEAVLADAEKQGSERYVCAGDIVGYGANPHECVERVRNLTSQIVAKLLHLPTVRMKEAAAGTDGVIYADVVRHLFGLGEEEQS